MIWGETNLFLVQHPYMTFAKVSRTYFPRSPNPSPWGALGTPQARKVLGFREILPKTDLPSLKLTANAPENRPGPQKERRMYSNHPFLGASC